MKTVKDFKDAGLVFVNNDIIGCVNSDPDSGGITIGDATRNGELPIHNAWNVREFAWREKTSIMLGFIGKIECINEHGKPLKGPISYYACTKWRPLLKQNTVDVSIETPEEKEALDKIFGADSAPKPSKTVWDSVNELCGDVNNSPARHRGDEGCVLYYKPDYIYVTSTNNNTSVEHQYVCTVAEFNALVEEMTLGLDVNPVNHGHYLNYVNADKVLLEKENKPLVYTQGMVDGGFQVEFSTWLYTEAGQCLVADKSLLKKGSTVNKPLVYTQEMADNGELPSVGMKCIAESKGIVGGSYLVTVSQINDKGQFACIDDNGDYLIHYPNEDKSESFKPIDTRTKKEKAIDELRDLDDSICNDIEWHAHFLQAIIDGKITGVKWVGE